MRETSKMFEIRKARGDFTSYLRGDIIDIGCGDDPLVLPDGVQGTVRKWDKQDGDAMLMQGVPDNSFDCVYSSHCLEHLQYVPTALENWGRICKPGGYLYIVVPDYLLYEHMQWPSRFNPDHKQSFSGVFSRKLVQRGNHWGMSNLKSAVDEIPGLQFRSASLECGGYDFNVGPSIDQTRFTDAVAQICILIYKRPPVIPAPAAE